MKRAALALALLSLAACRQGMYDQAIALLTFPVSTRPGEQQVMSDWVAWRVVDGQMRLVISGADGLSVVPAQQASPLVARVLRLGETIVPVLAPAALEPRGSLR